MNVFYESTMVVKVCRKKTMVDSQWYYCIKFDISFDKIIYLNCKKGRW